MRFFALLPLIYGAGHLYFFLCLRRAFGGGKWQIPVIFWLLAMVLGWIWRFGRNAGPWGEKAQVLLHVWMAFIVLCLYCLVATDALALIARLAARLSGAQALKQAVYYLSAPRAVPAALAASALLFAYCLYEARSPVIREVALRSAKIPPGTPPLRIAAIADLHLSGIIGPRMLTDIAARIKALKPDILVMAGDLVDVNMDEREEDAAILRSMAPPLGVFAVTGNHESYRGLDMALRFMERAGLRVLRGEYVEAGGIVIAGVDDRTFAGRFAPDTASVPRLAAMLPQGAFALLLNHQPYCPPEAVGAFDLQFSGHTHGGQIWPGRLLTRKIYGVEQGMNTLRQGDKQGLLYVSNGVGFWGPPVRLLTPPEITLFLIGPQ